MGVEPKYNSSEEEYVDVEIPDVTGMSKSDAGIAIDESGLEVKATRSVAVPNVVGKTPAEENSTLVSEGLNAKIKGVSKSGKNATCIGQSPVEGTMVEPGTVVSLNFRYDESETTND